MFFHQEKTTFDSRFSFTCGALHQDPLVRVFLCLLHFPLFSSLPLPFLCAFQKVNVSGQMGKELLLLVSGAGSTVRFAMLGA